MGNNTSSKVDSNLLSKCITGLISVRDNASLKITKDDVVARNVPAKNIESATKTLNSWRASFLGVSETSNHETLTAFVRDILGHLGYPSITIKKSTSHYLLARFELISEDAGVKVAEFTIKYGQLPPECYEKCYVLDCEGNYKLITQDRFDYFLSDIAGYETLKYLIRDNKIPLDNKAFIIEESEETILTINSDSHYVESDSELVPKFEYGYENYFDKKSLEDRISTTNWVINNFLKFEGGDSYIGICAHKETLDDALQTIKTAEELLNRLSPQVAEAEITNLAEFREVAERIRKGASEEEIQEYRERMERETKEYRKSLEAERAVKTSSIFGK